MRKTALLLGLIVSLFFPALSQGQYRGPQKGQKVAFLGDSITAYGYGPSGYVQLVAKALEQEGFAITIIPAGVSGNTSKDMLARVGNDVINKKPDWMTLSCGVNDVMHGANGVPFEQYQKKHHGHRGHSAGGGHQGSPSDCYDDSRGSVQRI